MWIRTFAAGTAVFAASGIAVAQGLLSFDRIPGVNQEPAVAIDINPVMIGFVREIARQADPTTADMLDGLRNIRVRVYHDVGNTRQFNNFIADVTTELEGSGWMPVVAAQDEGSNVRIHMQMTEQEVSGMTVMMTDGSEAVFINIDGSIDAQDLGAVLARFPIQEVMGGWPMPPGPPGPWGAADEPAASGADNE